MNIPGLDSDFFIELHIRKGVTPTSFPQCEIHADPINKSLYVFFLLTKPINLPVFHNGKQYRLCIK